MATFELPEFPITCDVWDGTTFPPTTKRIADLACALFYERGAGNSAELWVAKGTDIRPLGSGATHGDFINVPAGSSQWYQAMGFHFRHAGFNNEYWVADMSLNYPPSTVPAHS